MNTFRNIPRCMLAWQRLQSRQQHSQSPPCAPSKPLSLDRPISQPTHYTHPHLLSAAEVTPGITRIEYVERRRKLANELPLNSLVIFPANAQQYMSEDVPYAYHQNTDLTYAVGIAEPGSLLVVQRDAAQTSFTLCVPPRDVTRELWDGPRCGPSEDVRAYFAVDNVRSTEDLPAIMRAALPSLKSFHFDAALNPTVNGLLSCLSAPQQRALVRCWRQDAPPKVFLLPQRLVKSPAECALLRRAASISAAAINDSIASFRVTPDKSVTETDIDALLTYASHRRGAGRMAFPSVVAAGSNATVLHYMRKDAIAKEGDLIMVDTGCQVHGYCADISRSWPISGRFSGPQRDFYSLLLEAQAQCIDYARENSLIDKIPVSLECMHNLAMNILTDGLLQLGFLKSHSLESALETGASNAYFPHATGHFLGLDVHDTHLVQKNIPLKRGMVITVEPGLYCAVNDETAPIAFRGIGMRLEDDVIVGDASTGPEVISSDAVKDIDDIEALVGSRAL